MNWHCEEQLKRNVYTFPNELVTAYPQSFKTSLGVVEGRSRRIKELIKLIKKQNGK